MTPLRAWLCNVLVAALRRMGYRFPLLLELPSDATSEEILSYERRLNEIQVNLSVPCVNCGFDPLLKEPCSPYRAAEEYVETPDEKADRERWESFSERCWRLSTGNEGPSSELGGAA